MVLLTGKELDNASGLYYFGARYFDRGIGRWLAPDPITSEFSPYSYVHNRPLNYIDRFGLSDDLPPGYDYVDVPSFMFWGTGSGGFGTGGGGGGFVWNPNANRTIRYSQICTPYGCYPKEPFIVTTGGWEWVPSHSERGDNWLDSNMRRAGIDADKIRRHYALYYGIFSGIYGAGSRIVKDYEIGRIKPTDYGSRLKNLAAARGNAKFWRGAAKAALPIDLLLYGSDLYMASQSSDPTRGYYQATGSFVGGLTFGYLGALGGSFISPGVGTAAVGALGAFGGAELGEWVGGKTYDWFYKR